MLFYQRCAEVGVDAVLVADIPLLAKEDYVQAAKKTRHSTRLYLPAKCGRENDPRRSGK